MCVAADALTDTYRDMNNHLCEFEPLWIGAVVKNMCVIGAGGLTGSHTTTISSLYRRPPTGFQLR